MSFAAALPSTSWRTRSALPGFGLSLGFTIFYLSAVVLIPLAALIIRPWELGWSGFVAEVTAPRVLAALKLSFGAAAIGAVLNIVFGFIVAWSLVRYRFPLKRLVDALVDLPFALPTAVAGIVYASLYVPTGWYGRWLTPLGIEGADSRLGIVLVLTFTGCPFVALAGQPEPQEMHAGLEV